LSSRRTPPPAGGPRRAAGSGENAPPPNDPGTNAESGRAKAVGLVSGGLDSTLAAEMMARQGMDVTGLYFSTGFCKTDHRRAVQRAKDRDPERLRNEALRAGAEGGFPVEVIDVAEEYLQEVVLHPKHGYGQHINPCIDCRIFMLRKAKDYADAIGAETVFTGEVIGQRPFSQYRSALRLIEEQSGLEGRLLRPLSAKHLDPTRAEEEGRLDREALGSFGGRSRRGQEDLAREYGIEDFPQPSGGCCFLADATYARRFKDLVAHAGAESIDREQVLLLKVGRQFRLSPHVKLHVGREEAENRFLRRFAPGRWVLEALGLEGPTAILNGTPCDPDLETAAAIVARYADREGAPGAEIVMTRYERVSSMVSDAPGVLEEVMDECEPPLAERRLLTVEAIDLEAAEKMRL
jgi:tRNA-specific 2-thiouridylase